MYPGSCTMALGRAMVQDHGTPPRVPHRQAGILRVAARAATGRGAPTGSAAGGRAASPDSLPAVPAGSVYVRITASGDAPRDSGPIEGPTAIVTFGCHQPNVPPRMSARAAPTRVALPAPRRAAPQEYNILFLRAAYGLPTQRNLGCLRVSSSSSQRSLLGPAGPKETPLLLHPPPCSTT